MCFPGFGYHLLFNSLMILHCLTGVGVNEDLFVHYVRGILVDVFGHRL